MEKSTKSEWEKPFLMVLDHKLTQTGCGDPEFISKTNDFADDGSTFNCGGTS